MSSDLAVTEAGTRLVKFSDIDIDKALTVYILTGNATMAAQILREEEDIQVNSNHLRNWATKSFRARYYRLRSELRDDVAEEVAGRSMERAMQADEATQKLIERTVDNIDKIDPNQLANAAGRMAQVKASEVGRAQILRGQPTEITETRTVLENLSVLRRLGVVEGEFLGELDDEQESDSQG